MIVAEEGGLIVLEQLLQLQGFQVVERPMFDVGR